MVYETPLGPIPVFVDFAMPPDTIGLEGPRECVVARFDVKSKVQPGASPRG